MNLSDPKDLASLLEALLLASGKPVYVDKYLAHTGDDAREMVKIENGTWKYQP